MNTPAHIPAETTAATPARAARLDRFFAIFSRYAGTIAVDHTHVLTIDRVSGRTGVVAPTGARRCCC
jgi:hypothetical protein